MTTHPFRQRLGRRETILLDGGMGTALMARGLPRGTPPETWTLERPAAVTEVHRGYVDAGSEAVHTCTFGANPVRLAAFGLEAGCERIVRAAVACARAASPRFVIGDVGPTGEYLPPVGTGDASRWRDGFALQAKVLADCGVDALHVETMTDLREAWIALEALLEYAPGIPVLVSMTFERKNRGWFTIMGDPLAGSLRTLASGGASAVGTNCSVASGEITALVDEALAGLDAPFVAQPNAGTPVVSGDVLQYAQEPEAFATDMAGIAARGVLLVGGCCGTDARFIAALRGRLDAR